MTQFTVVGLDWEACDWVAERLRVVAKRAALPLDVRVSQDALDVQRSGRIGACTLLSGGHVVAQDPLPDDAGLQRLIVAASTAAGSSANAA